MESLPPESCQNNIFSEEPKTFEALLKLLNTYVGFNKYADPWDNNMLEINP